MGQLLDRTIKPIVWIVGKQFSANKKILIWRIFYMVFGGFVSFMTSYITAKTISQAAGLVDHSASRSDVFQWLAIAAMLSTMMIVIENVNSIIRRAQDNALDIAMNDYLIGLVYRLNQEQFEDEDFKIKFERANDGLYSSKDTADRFFRLGSDLIAFVSAITAVAFVSPLIALMIVVFALPSCIYQIKLNKVYDKLSDEQQRFDRISWRTRFMLIDTEYMPEVRLLGAFKSLLKIWRENTEISNQMRLNAEKRTFLMYSLTEPFRPLTEVVANIAFIFRLDGGTISFDRFIFLRSILASASSAMYGLTSTASDLHSNQINLLRLYELDKTQPVFANGKTKVIEAPNIKFVDVAFKYPGAEDYALRDVSFSLTPSSSLAIVGENGAGKSTLVKLLLRQYLPTEGQILINGTPIQDIEQVSYYRHIGNLSQDFLLMKHLTIRENLTIGVVERIDDKTIWQTLDDVGAASFVSKLEHELDQRLDSSFKDGAALSGGQEQRLAIARSLLRSPDSLILDEPTSAIDAKGEHKIFTSVMAKQAGKSLLIISHRFSTVRRADQIIVLEYGEIKEQGTHAQLMATLSLYAEMFEKQAEGYR